MSMKRPNPGDAFVASEWYFVVLVYLFAAAWGALAFALAAHLVSPGKPTDAAIMAVVGAAVGAWFIRWRLRRS